MMRSLLAAVHKYLSLAVMAVWLLQAVTGVMLVFHWELDDWGVGGPRRPLDPPAFSRGLDQMLARRPGDTLVGVYPSGGSPNRFDVLLQRPDETIDALRVDGAGAVLRERPWNYDRLHIGVFQIATYLHQTLFAHDPGKWFLGVSGLLLVSNIVMGLVLAWPRRGMARKALLPAASPRPAISLFNWHRAAGLWLGLPALLTIACGVVMAFEAPLHPLFADPRPEPSVQAVQREPAAGPVTAGRALAVAFAVYPGAPLASLEPPSAEAPWWSVGVRRAGEWRRTSGNTVVYVSSRTGQVLAARDALTAPARTRAWNSLYALHTGEAGGVAGRVAVTVLGLWLLTMCGLGLSLWFVRRQARRPRKEK